MGSLVDHFEEAIRNNKDSYVRWLDQKVTFDNFHSISKAIDLGFPSDKQQFTRVDLQNSKTLESILTRLYGKPSLNEDSASNEYDKFIGQTLGTMTYGRILERERVGHSFKYRVINREVLRKAASTEIDALDVLTDYIEAALREAGWWNNIEQYIASDQTESDYAKLKDSFLYFSIEHLRLGTKKSSKPSVEAGRVFAKMLNPLALRFGANGSNAGKVMNTIPCRFDIEYNRPNFRDIANKKPKRITRSVYNEDLEKQAQQAPSQSQISASMKKVREYHNGISEIPDTSGRRATHVHHIFPQSSFPELKNQRENLIALTPGQHLGEAHRDGNTSSVDKIYQITCLYQKLKSVIESEKRDDGMYSIEGFAQVLQSGFGLAHVPATIESCRLAIRNN